MDTPGDVVAMIDQMTQAARQSARPIAAFYDALKEDGVDEDTRGKLTVLYADRILLGGSVGP